MCSLACFSQDIVINELMASNKSTIQDVDGDYSDWIELYNTTSDPILLSDYSLSDDFGSPDKWSLPSVILPPSEFLVIFASDKDRRDPTKELHTNFKISADGEFVGLFKSKTLEHSIPSVALSGDQSRGLISDGSSTFTTFQNATPGTSNTLSLIFYPLTFSAVGGFYKESFDLKIAAKNGSDAIRYTLDGNLPRASSATYPVDGLRLDSSLFSRARLHQIKMTRPGLHNPPTGDIPKCILVNAASFSVDGKRTSPVATHTYFIKPYVTDHGDLPIVSFSIPHYDIYNHDSGLMVPGVHWKSNSPFYTGNFFQSGRAWEREVNVEYFNKDEINQLNQRCGIRLHGIGTRITAQKSLRLYARSEYGTSQFQLKTFEDRDHQAYKRFVLKPMTGSWSQNGVTDYMVGKLVQNVEVDYVASKPVVVYIDGEYWGIYFLQERIDRRYLAQNRSEVQNEDSIDLITSWSGQISEGNNKNFLALYEYMANADLSDINKYNEVIEWIDIPNFIDYQLTQIFITNYDWPVNNMKCWRERREGAKWRWIVFDGDAALQKIPYDGFRHATDSISSDWPTNPYATLFLRKLLENKVFYVKFWTRFEYLINNDFKYANTKPFVEFIKKRILAEVDNQVIRFGKPVSYAEWESSIDFLLKYLNEKTCVLNEHILRDYHLNPHYSSG